MVPEAFGPRPSCCVSAAGLSRAACSHFVQDKTWSGLIPVSILTSELQKKTSTVEARSLSDTSIWFHFCDQGRIK